MNQNTTPEKKCEKDHCHDCAGCGYERPMTKGEAELSAGLDAFLASQDDEGV